MPENEKEVKAEEKKPVETKPAAEATSQEQNKPAPESKEGAKKSKKISLMTLAEVESELKTVKEKMGGFQSGFAQNLLARKKELSQS